MSAQHLWTFGHSTRSEKETVALLQSAHIGCVVDVRTIRGSRHNPQFGQETMPEWLAAATIDYRWIADLGGRRGKQPIDPDINAGWHHPSFHRYADYTLTECFETGLGELSELVTSASQGDSPRASGVVIMCAEAVPWRCHRSLIATVLIARGWQVTHLLGIDQQRPHQLGQWGATPQINADGTVTYPAAESA